MTEHSPVISDEEIKTKLDEYWELYWELWNDAVINESDYESGFDYWTLEAQRDASDAFKDAQYKAEIAVLKEELRIGNILTAKLTDKCRELEAKIAEAVREALVKTGVALEEWMGDETAPYRRIAQVEHAIIKLKRGPD